MMVTCPFHKNHRENKPACGIFLKDYKGFKKGDFHCFVCGESGNIVKLTSQVLDLPYNEAEDWLVDNFGGDNIDEELPEIVLEDPKPSPNMSEDILKLYDYYHPYMWKRKLTKEVVDRFRVGYDKSRNAITFPVWDAQGNLKFITARSVNTKRFWIPKNVDKPVYLLNFAIKDGVKALIVTEAQLDALTAWSYGFPCCATMGNISKFQIENINRSGIRIIITAFDNDEAGDSFTHRFNSLIREDILVYRLEWDKSKKDLNDLSKEEFWDALKNLGFKEELNESK